MVAAKFDPWFLDREPIEEVPEGFLGFVYRITDTETNKKYIGKKIFYNRIARPPLKGAKRKRRELKESNWKTYFGSNKTLNEIVTSDPRPERFKREILRLCETKSEMSYYETKTILEVNALMRDDYFNDWISCKITRQHMKAASLKLK